MNGYDSHLHADEPGSDEVTVGHPWHAALWDGFGDFGEAIRRDIAGGARGSVLEVGVGTGFNFPYYQRNRVATLTAIDPDPFMLRRAAGRARGVPYPLALRQARAEALPFGSGTFDTVVCTLVLCTADPARSLAEIRRVLKPGGELRFYEHVRGNRPLLGALTDIIDPVWSRVGAGCHPNRDTASHVRRAGFSFQRLAWLCSFEIAGVAVPGR